MGERRKFIPCHPAAPSSLRNLLPWGVRAPGRSSGQGPRSPSFCGGQGSGGPGWGEAGGETLSQRSDPCGEKLVRGRPFPLRAEPVTRGKSGCLDQEPFGGPAGAATRPPPLLPLHHPTSSPAPTPSVLTADSPLSRTSPAPKPPCTPRWCSPFRAPCNPFTAAKCLLKSKLD